MKFLITLSVLLISAQVFARKGPLPHERTDTPKMNNTTTGRYMYVGNVPKFDGTELEITISKINLTSRVTGYVTQERINGYANTLFLRWKNINDALMDMNLSVHPLVKISKLAEKKPINVQAWAKIVEQYSSHVLEASDQLIYSEFRNASNFPSPQIEEEYKDAISKALFQYYFDTKELADDVISDSKKFEKLLSIENSQRLFTKHLGHLYTSQSDRPGFVGTLNFVYPIAATVEGPFDQPKEQITDMKTAESIEARWWSNKWNDEFGGFPFLLIEWSGVAFHGPITNYGPMDVWYLRRGYVSHGCHRMDGSDVLELRALMPVDLKKAMSKIKITVLDYFDVVDWNKDGTVEAIDVKYYQVPSSVAVAKGKTIDEVIVPFTVEKQMKTFIKNNKYAAKYYDSATDKLKGIPKYSVNKKTLVREGVHEEVGIYRFEYRPSRILQYTEEGIKLQGFDDSAGKYPPKYFQRF